MFTHTLTYNDWNGNKVTEKFYFNLSKPELIELNVNWDGGLEPLFEKLQKAEDPKAMFNFVRTLLHKSYGVKSDDGREFAKSDEILKSFLQSRAYEEIFDLLNDDEFGEAFIRGVFPEELIREYDKAEKQNALLPPLPGGASKE